MPEYQYGQDPIDLTSVKEVLPSELSASYFRNLDAAMARAEKVQMDRTLGAFGDKGFLRSGDAFTGVAQDVLGPSMERRNQVLLPELQRAAGQGRDERLQATQFNRQKELTSIEHMNKLEELQKQSEIQRMLMELQDSLSGGGSMWGQIGGAALGSLAGSMTGGFGGAAGYWAGNSLFGAAGKKPGTP